MKGVGILVVSLRGTNLGCWSHLACAGQNAIIFSHEGLVQGCTRKNIKIYTVCVLTWSLLGVKKSLSHAQIGLLQGFNSKFPTSIPTPFIYGVPPRENFTDVFMVGGTNLAPHHTKVCIHCFWASIASKVYYNPTAVNTPTKWSFL